LPGPMLAPVSLAAYCSFMQCRMCVHCPPPAHLVPTICALPSLPFPPFVRAPTAFNSPYLQNFTTLPVSHSPHRTAPHRTAQHSTAQHSTLPCPPPLCSPHPPALYRLAAPISHLTLSLLRTCFTMPLSSGSFAHVTLRFRQGPLIIHFQLPTFVSSFTHCSPHASCHTHCRPAPLLGPPISFPMPAIQPLCVRTCASLDPCPITPTLSHTPARHPHPSIHLSYPTCYPLFNV
jgi:hypothetical protein